MDSHPRSLTFCSQFVAFLISDISIFYLKSSWRRTLVKKFGNAGMILDMEINSHIWALREFCLSSTKKHGLVVLCTQQNKSVWLGQSSSVFVWPFMENLYPFSAVITHLWTDVFTNKQKEWRHYNWDLGTYYVLGLSSLTYLCERKMLWLPYKD